MKKSAYIFNNGELKRKDSTVLFESDGVKNYLPIEDITDIYVFGEVTVSKKFLEIASQKEILLHFFNYYEYYVGTYYPREHYNSGYMILKQAEYYLDTSKRFFLAKMFVYGASRNILSVLKYYHKRGKDLEKEISTIESLTDRIDSASEISELMAIEGNIRDIYYDGFDKIINDELFEFKRRTKRPPLNRLNSLISFGNSLLYTCVLSEIYKTHLDPRIGYLHTTNNRRFTLNLDVAEIFKPIIVDRTIFTLTGRKMLSEKHFEKKAGGVILNDAGKKVFVSQFNEKLKTTLMHKSLGREVSYRRLIRMELYKLQKHFMGEENFSPYIASW
ncbi:type I-B CRISPR-associated endonuclease Cas1b [Acetivibrio saccincola]|jgi:CRISPR-associated protein Cas1|uniref:CRISPR-associated endonuclease Cas1 n=1 Tax=Acetivibrio saccincola TaxID=1677857 RepID=A0A2S8RAZ3_9FIRM|nr:type I-B CRISPR-associated endonuclease Cas1b [Acetivibrio saccincola]NLW27917.1 type I-B CRISPR-associated endonuclease Cas1 [Acetivibrio saccincola]PQQ66955.1 subtype I-B CRISPR-associated endonuclease Cas1 [Acetivibrio saccincola]HOA96820.1 type I-B CRISPR-associated endonuclease Cas1b [Acetivibrio saccincola]HQD29592.1 type I-B CRISPR-associated endonuclease Cas1b [Acetivibrio saccincola]